MIMGALIAETFIQSELQHRRERAMQQYNRRPHQHHKRHLAWPFARHTRAAGQHHPAVS
ncbi:MAG: hypothetical protein QOI51_315 [Nocardioidaceae bacterium]|jgi:hypothetical protein|nr:hypothetical protein [Nocardioidaceae bacterium]MDX6307709.1 hypothetical protein [Nocardioidaceae bacterium]